MNQIVTQGIILSRTNFGEADRIITVLTPDHGKLRLMVKGARRAKSKLAGGIELFSVSDLTYINGKGEIGTLISSRLKKYYDNIVKDLGRTQLGYELIKTLNKATEDEPEAEYFKMLEEALKALDDDTIKADLIKVWFQAQILKQAGHRPNLTTDTNDEKLSEKQTYNFDFDDMTFSPHSDGHTTPQQIKTLRLIFDGHPPKKLQQVQGLTDTLPTIEPLVRTMLQSHIRT